MWRQRKWIIAVVLGVMVLAASLGGIALASEDDSNSQSGPGFGDMLERVCAIYNEKTDPDIDCDILQEAFNEARDEMRQAAMDDRIDRMVEEGLIDEPQAEAFKAWLKDMPEGIPFGLGFRGHGGFRGMGGPPAPPTSEE